MIAAADKLTDAGTKCATALSKANLKHLKEVNLASIVGIGLLHMDDDFDTYINEIYNMDFQCSYAWSKHGSLYLEGMNLLNFAERRYIGKEWRNLRTEYYGLRFQLGIRLDL